MPKINRIRLVNITYDRNYIKDVIFDLYDGSNALFNLANGCGKSVLVQMIFQPVLPCMSIDKRKITDYIPKGNAPAHMLIEWLLDDTKVPTYFLTGIAMVATREHSTDFENDGESPDVKYFTFTNEYTVGNDYDIVNLPIVQYSDGKKLLIPYNDIYAKLKTFSEKDSNFKYYHKIKFDEYRKSLMQHRIHTSEWKLLSKINQKEGGLSMLFEHCKTSDALFDKCILKTITDTVPEDRKSLIDCLTQLTKSILSSDEKLHEKELFESFNVEFTKCLSNFEEYSRIVDEKSKRETYLLGVLKHIQNLIQHHEDELKQAQTTQDTCIKKCEHVRQERVSQDYYETLSELEQSQSSLASIRVALQECLDRVNTAEYAYSCMDASKYYNDMVSQRNTLEAIKQTIETIKNGEDGERLTNIGYSLYTYYTNAEEQSRQLHSNLTSEMATIESKRNSTNTEIKSLERTKEGLIQRKAMLNSQLMQFETQETQYKDYLEVLPERDLLGNLAPESVESISHKLENETQAQAKFVESLLHKEKDLRAKFVTLQTEESKLNENLNTQRKLLSEAEQRLERCNAEIAHQKTILHDYEIAEEYIFDKDGNLNTLNETLTNLSKKLLESQSKRREFAETLRNFQDRQLHASRRFARVLEDNGIAFQTGEDYLVKQPKEYQLQLLDNNPMLPYCFILDDSNDFKKVLHLETDTYIDRLCPVILKNTIDQSMHFDGIKVYSLYNFESINPDTRSNFKDHLNSEISRLDEQIKGLESSKQKCSVDVATVRDFTYTQKDFDRLNNAVATESTRLDSVESSLLKCKASQNETLDRFIAIKDSITEARKVLKSSQEKQSKFGEYLELAKLDLSTREQFAEVSSQLELVFKNIKALETEFQALSGELETKRELYFKASHAVDIYTEKLSNYALFEHGNLIDAPIEQLEIEYRNLRQKTSLALEEKEELCKELSKKISSNRHALTKYQNLSEKDYAIEYDAFKLKELKARYYDVKSEYDKLSNKEVLENEKIQRYQQELSRRLRELNSYNLSEPLGSSEIHGNYSQRLKTYEETAQYAKQVEELSKKQIDDCQKKANRIERIIDVDDTTNVDNIVEITETVDINKERADLKRVFSKLATAKDTLVASIQQARTFKTCNHPSIVSIVANMDGISLQNLENYYESFRIYENLTANQKHLNDIIQYLTFELQAVENNRNNMVMQSYTYAKRLHEQVMWLPLHSHITLHNKNIRIKTLDFNVPTELDETSEERIKNFVDSAINKLRQLSRNDDFKPENLEKLVNEIFSDRAIFNVVTGTNTVKVRLCKFQKDARNSRLESWESAYSGGEKFMAYFVLYSTLTAYTRSHFTPETDNNTRSVFLIDNPFGTTSSTHLLNAFVDITNRFNLQLICFSDLKQSSITNSFDLIYQLSLKDVAYQKARLSVDVVQNQSGVQPNSSLEHISLKEDFTQLEL